MLSKNLKFLRKKQGATQNQVANAVGITRSALADYENDKSEPKASVLIKLADYFEINVHDLLKNNIDTPFLQNSSRELKSLHNSDIRVVAITVQKNQKQNIEFVPVTAIAGYAKSFDNPEYLKQLTHFSLPKLPEGTFRAFEIKGDSMLPITDGSIVIGKYIEHYSEIENGKRYVFILRDDGVVFKRAINEVNQSKRLILISDNQTFSPYTVKITDVLEAWEIISFIGDLTKQVDYSQAILDKLYSIEQKIDKYSIK